MANNTVNNPMTSHDTAGIEVPSHSDCVFGRGKSFQNHPGNLVLHRLVDERLEEYRRAKVGPEKNLVINGIVHDIQNGDTNSNRLPGRFIRRGANIGKQHVLWEEVDDVDARAKVGHTIRSRMRAVDIANGVLQPSGRRRNQDKYAASSGLDSTRISSLTKRSSADQNQPRGVVEPPVVEVPSPTTENSNMGGIDVLTAVMTGPAQTQTQHSCHDHQINVQLQQLPSLQSFMVTAAQQISHEQNLKLLVEARMLQNASMQPQFPQLGGPYNRIVSTPASYPHNPLLPLVSAPLSQEQLSILAQSMSETQIQGLLNQIYQMG